MRKQIKTKKVIIFGLMLALMLGGCSSSKKEEQNTSVNKEQVSETADKDEIITIGDEKVTREELMLYLLSTKEEVENQYGKDIWSYVMDAEGTTFDEVMKEQLLEDIKYIKTVVSKASELGIELGEEELLDVNTYASDFMAEFSEEQKAQYNIREEVVKQIYRDNLLATKVYESLTLNVDTEVSDEEARQAVFQYILVANCSYDEDGNRIDYTEEEIAAAKQRAEELDTEAKECDDFLKFAQDNTDDTDEVEITAGLGDMLSSLEDVAFKLNQGEVSDVIETSEGYFIFYCVTPMDIEATNEKKEEIIKERQDEAFDSKYAEWSKSVKVTISDEQWSKISFSDMN